MALATAGAPFTATGETDHPVDAAQRAHRSEAGKDQATTPDPVTTESQLIYFSSTSENTSRFVAKLGRESGRIPLYPKDAPLLAARPFVLVLPTYRDSCSLVVLEALACGLPVISTRQNGATEVMTDGEHGTILADPGDPRLAAALSEMLDDRRRARMRAACVALRPALSWEHHLETLLGLYGRVVRQRRGLG